MLGLRYRQPADSSPFTDAVETVNNSDHNFILNKRQMSATQSRFSLATFVKKLSSMWRPAGRVAEPGRPVFRSAGAARPAGEGGGESCSRMSSHLAKLFFLPCGARASPLLASRSSLKVKKGREKGFLGCFFRGCFLPNPNARLTQVVVAKSTECLQKKNNQCGFPQLGTAQ